MKVAISSSSFARLLATGDLTQLEWVERCASTLGADGIVFDQAHFPRADGEYLAQLKKVTVDLGLVPVAIDAPRLFRLTADGAEAGPGDDPALAFAAGLGALFVLTILPPPGDVPPATFVAAVGAAKAAARRAKAANITLLVGLAPGTLAEDVPALRHFLKDVDSAWLRYALPAAVDRSGLHARDRALVVTVAPGDDLALLAEVDEATRPWLLLTGDVDRTRVDDLRRAAARKILDIDGAGAGSTSNGR